MSNNALLTVVRLYIYSSERGLQLVNLDDLSSFQSIGLSYQSQSRERRRENQKKRRQTHARDVIVITDGFLKETIPNLPSKNGRAFSLELRYLADDIVGGHARFGTANCTRSDRARLVIPGNNHAQHFPIHSIQTGVKDSRLVKMFSIFFTFQESWKRIRWRLVGFGKYRKVGRRNGPARRSFDASGRVEAGR